MLAEAGGIACSFNATIYSGNIQHVPGMVEWAREHIDIVHTMVFICFRHVVPDLPFRWFAGDREVDWQSIWYHSDASRRVDLESTDVLDAARETDPDMVPAAYLNGTEQPDTFKWLLSERIGTRERTYGWAGPKFVELASAVHHFVKDRYLSYVSPRTSRSGRAALAFLWPFDRGIRGALRRYLGALLRNPARALERVHLQSLMFIQPVDFLPDGRQSMCDGCPDVTVHEGSLVWSCRLEELKAHGTFLRTVPRRT